MDGQSLVLLGVLLLAAVLLVLWTWHTRRKELGPTYKRMSRAPSQEDRDAADAKTLAEVRVYLAFGRKDAAVAVLEEALKKDSSRVRLREVLEELKAAE